MEGRNVDKLIRTKKTKKDVDELIRAEKITKMLKISLKLRRSTIKMMTSFRELKRSDLWKSFRWSLSLSPSVHCGQKRHFTLTISPTEDDPSKAILGMLSTLD